MRVNGQSKSRGADRGWLRERGSIFEAQRGENRNSVPLHRRRQTGLFKLGELRLEFFPFRGGRRQQGDGFPLLFFEGCGITGGVRRAGRLIQMSPGALMAGLDRSLRVGDASSAVA